MSTRSTFECFGLILHGYGWGEVSRRLESALLRGEHTWIVTANAEILMAAKDDPAYWHVLHEADLRLVDGSGPQFFGWLCGASPERFAGVDLAEHLLGFAAARGWSVGLLGGGDGVADRAAWEIRARYPGISVHAERGGHVDASGLGDAETDEVIQRLTQYGPDLLLVAFGHPKQERWIARQKELLPSVKIIVGVGGTLDFWTGIAARAPQWMRVVGLEWLWRLVTERWRFRRIMTAVVRFPLSALAEKIGVGRRA